MNVYYKIERFKIKISLFKHKYIFRLYKSIEGEHSIGSYKLYEGTYSECIKYANENNLELKR